MSSTNQQLLIDHLDSTLTGKGFPDMEQLIRNDRIVAEEWQYLHLAVEAVQEAALFEQVGAVKKQWMAVQSNGTLKLHPTNAFKSDKTKVIGMYKNIARIAACIIVLAGGASIYKYTSTNSSAIYQQYYSSYDLNTTRSAVPSDPMEQAYSDKNWAQVITLFNTAKEKTNQSYFLTGMANLELKNYADAIEKFHQVLAENTRSGSDLFQDEAEYYLAMSYLANNEADLAMPLLDKIKADKDHIYHQVVAKMSSLDLHIIDYKAKK
jgi:tetratricopeptide (TPR) repeat protein